MNKILLVSPFPPYIGGVSVSSKRLFDNLVKDDYIVDKYDIKYSNQKYNKYQVFKLLRFLFLPIYLLSKQRYDVVHFHISGSLLKCYVSLFRCFFSKKTKFIATIHGDVSVLLADILGKYCLKGFDSIICVKKGDKERLGKCLNSPIHEIPAFIPPIIEPLISLPKNILDFFDNDSFKITVNGALICNNDYHDLYGFMDVLVLVNKLKKAKKDIKLLLINLGNKSGVNGESYLKELKEYIKTNNINDCVYWHEGASLDFYSVLNEVDLFIRPTKTDGDALSIREAFCLKVPTIASDVIDRPENTVVYNQSDPSDLFNKTIDLFDNYDRYKSLISNEQVDFYKQIQEQYDV